MVRKREQRGRAKAGIQNISQNAAMMLHVLDYEGCDNKVDYLLGVQ